MIFLGRMVSKSTPWCNFSSGGIHVVSARSCGRLSQCHSGPGNRERAGYFLVNLAAGLLGVPPPSPGGHDGPATRQLAFDAQATVFAHGLFVNDVWGKFGNRAG
jgi:hypothetical protein